MKKFFALIFAAFSGVYLLLGPIPDPLPLVDEGVALVIFLNCLAALGLDLRKYIGMGPKKKRSEPEDHEPRKVRGRVVD